MRMIIILLICSFIIPIPYPVLDRRRRLFCQQFFRWIIAIISDSSSLQYSLRCCCDLLIDKMAINTRFTKISVLNKWNSRDEWRAVWLASPLWDDKQHGRVEERRSTLNGRHLHRSIHDWRIKFLSNSRILGNNVMQLNFRVLSLSGWRLLEKSWTDKCHSRLVAKK